MKYERPDMIQYGILYNMELAQILSWYKLIKITNCINSTPLINIINIF